MTTQQNPISYTITPTRKYMLTRPLHVDTDILGESIAHFHRSHLDPEGHLILSAGYQWDGPSGPAPDLACLMRASAAHDALCLMIHARLIPRRHQRTADRLFYTIARQDQAPLWLSFLSYRLLRAYDTIRVHKLPRSYADTSEPLFPSRRGSTHLEDNHPANEVAQ